MPTDLFGNIVPGPDQDVVMLEPTKECDDCNTHGAYDVYGDILCPGCLVAALRYMQFGKGQVEHLLFDPPLPEDPREGN